MKGSYLFSASERPLLSLPGKSYRKYTNKILALITAKMVLRSAAIMLWSMNVDMMGTVVEHRRQRRVQWVGCLMCPRVGVF
jgi:hypothetical protein